MASEERSISGAKTKGSSRVDGEPISSIPSKRSSGEATHDSSKRQKVAFGLSSKQSGSDSKTVNSKGSSKPGIQIKLNSQKNNVPIPPVKSRPTAAIFNNDDDDEEPEEMPPEARMRMRNIGRDTPTSAGPNSFGKTKQGFCDSKKVFEKSLKAAIERAGSN
ncbi:UNVERIFIED_CONTAM: hypothetical protein PYX00_002785 [Menopon gallinae]|uniref:PEST proteolytic signal-containing nuclear protein n=1 Tax=Menopon gallinae TaxID=328185 RepID=A0AAW2HY18_9NEOP